MKALLQKKLNKKGFTLAELLVVVAILAILIAIAVPVFTGMMKDADKTVQNANIRAVRAAGVAEILLNWDTYKGTDASPNTKWYATADVTGTGDVKNLKITAGSSTETGGTKGTDGYTGVTANISDIHNSLSTGG